MPVVDGLAIVPLSDKVLCELQIFKLGPAFTVAKGVMINAVVLFSAAHALLLVEVKVKITSE